jgi:hypothetical protein
MRRPVGWAVSACQFVSHAPWAIKAVAYGLFFATKCAFGIFLPGA